MQRDARNLISFIKINAERTYLWPRVIILMHSWYLDAAEQIKPLHEVIGERLAMNSLK